MTAKNLLLAACVAFSGAVFAQGANQSWSATDIDGNTVDIQALLNSGKTVLVDISAHWCGPCWSWHESEIMTRAWEEFGPNGTGDLEVIWLDGDAGSTMALLNGGPGSQGDWIGTSPFTVIGPNGQGNAVANNYNFPGYPTLFMHCPGANEGVEIQRADFDTFITNWYNGCTGAFTNGANDATLYGHHGDIKVCPGDGPSVELVNVGSSALTSATVELKDQNGAVLETQQWTGNLAALETDMVQFTTGVPGWASFEFVVSNPNGTADANPAGDAEWIGFASADQAGTDVTIEILTDDYGAETGWTLYDGSGAIVQQVAAGGYANTTTYTYPQTLVDGECYKFEITDTYGDGICCSWGNGHYMIYETANPSNIFFQGGEFASSDLVPFEAKTNVGIDEANASNDLLIFPNPSTGIVNVQLNTSSAAAADVQVYDLLGGLVVSRNVNFASAESNEVFDLSALNNGVYVFSINVDGNITTKRVTINK